MNLVQKITIPIDSPFIPPEVRRRIEKEGNVIYPVRFSRPERRVLRKRVKPLVSKWARTKRTVTYGPFEGQLWQSKLTPYLDGIMDTIAFPSVREFFLMKGVQTGGSEAVNNFVGWAIEYDPAPVLYLYPDTKTARENSQDRIQPMIERTPSLAEFYTGKDDDVTKFRIKLIHMPLYVAWASSAAQLANKPVCYLVEDEVDLYDLEVSKDHSDALSEGRDRLTTFKRLDRSKLIALSTPTRPTGAISISFEKAQAKFELWVKCPHCDKYQIMVFEQIKWPRIHPESGEFVPPEEVPEDDVEREKFRHPDPDVIRQQDLAYYQCEHCQTRWTTTDRDLATKESQWIERESGLELMAHLKKHKPYSVGMKLPSWPSWFFSLSDAAGLWVEYVKSKDKRKLKRFLNKMAAETYEEWAKPRKSEKLLAELRDPDRPEMLIPGTGDEVSILLAGVDTQDYGFWYWIWALGWADDAPTWDIRHGWVTSNDKRDFKALEQVLWNTEYKDVAGNSYGVAETIIDTGGHRTTEAYEWCRQNRGRVIALKGTDRRGAVLNAWRKVDHYPNSTKAIRGGLMRFDINAEIYRDTFSNLLEIKSGDPDALSFHGKTTSRDVAQLCAMVFDDQAGKWINPHQRAEHYFAIGTYLCALIDYRKYRFLKKPEPTPTVKLPAENDHAPGRGNWLHGGKVGRPGWMDK